MFNRILIPLDGCPVAAAALPYAQLVAARTGARLILVRAAHFQRPLGNAADQQQVIAEAEDYLTVHARRLAKLGFEVETGVPFGGSAADWIVEEIDIRHADLVVMATHDRIGPDRWVHGSVAEMVVGRAAVPVLLVGPTHGAQPAQPLASERPVLVVPLDGSELAEAALPLASALATTLGGHIVLVSVVPGRGDLVTVEGALVPFVGDDNEGATIEARVYLDGIVNRFKASGHGVTATVRSGIPAQHIAAVASDHRASTVVMATHGRTGIARSILGSVAGETLHHSPCPVMLIRPATLRPIEEPVPSRSVAAAAGA